LAFTEEEELEEGELSPDTEQVKTHVPLNNMRLTVYVPSQPPLGHGQHLCLTTPDPAHRQLPCTHHSPL
jgi:hypothetical protein